MRPPSPAKGVTNRIIQANTGHAHAHQGVRAAAMPMLPLALPTRVTRPANVFRFAPESGSPILASMSTRLVPRFRSSQALAARSMRTSESKNHSNFMTLVGFEFEVAMTVVPQQLIGTSNSPHWSAREPLPASSSRYSCQLASRFARGRTGSPSCRCRSSACRRTPAAPRNCRSDAPRGWRRSSCRRRSCARRGNGPAPRRSGCDAQISALRSNARRCRRRRSALRSLCSRSSVGQGSSALAHALRTLHARISAVAVHGDQPRSGGGRSRPIDRRGGST